MPPLPKFTRRKREPPNPDIPWISAIPMSNELDELKTRIKQIEFNRDEEVSALEEQLELAETEAIESTEKIETELKAIIGQDIYVDIDCLDRYTDRHCECCKD